MDVRNCRGCGRLFNYVVGPFLCQACRGQMEVKFQEVKEYIRAHPGVGIKEVSVACDVETAQIQQWLREERLEVTESSPIFLSCESCGANIRCGKYCEKCKTAMTNSFKKVLSDSRPKSTEPAKPTSQKANPKMRFLN